VDLLSSILLVALALAPAQVAPWTNERARWRGVARGAIMVAFVPLFLMAFVADQAWAPVARRGHRLTNVYALIARRN
jgi:hypothetical protein